jgi:hypothetical protein
VAKFIAIGIALPRASISVSGDHVEAWLQSPYERRSIASVTFSSAAFTRLKAAAYFSRSMFDQ